MKTRRAKENPGTHFEQVPVEVVMKIAGVTVSKEEAAGPHNVIVEPASGKTEPYSMPARLLRRTGL